ncbi:hypothetical protein TNCV_4945821 [Trichonephila clavipes]|nr:hypothetical protein TNCV_4945821 [Trichonephila clavipes]
MLDLGQPISSNSSWQKKSGANGTSIILSRSHTSKLPMTQTHFERKMFDNISEIQRNVTRLLKCISKEDFLQSFQDMYCTSQGCIVMRGDYFEGDCSRVNDDGPRNLNVGQVIMPDLALSPLTSKPHQQEDVKTNQPHLHGGSSAVVGSNSRHTNYESVPLTTRLP